MARIFFADDDIEQLTVQRKLLETLGHEVGTATSAAEALRELQRQSPDLIVVDLRFPNSSDGLALVRSIREAGWRQPLIVLSGWPDDLYGSPEEAMVTRIIVKGSTRELLRTIAELTS